MHQAQISFESWEKTGEFIIPDEVSATILSMRRSSDENDPIRHTFVFYPDGSELSLTVNKLLGRDNVCLGWTPPPAASPRAKTDKETPKRKILPLQFAGIGLGISGLGCAISGMAMLISFATAHSSVGVNMGSGLIVLGAIMCASGGWLFGVARREPQS